MAELQNSSSELTTGLLLNKNLFEEDFDFGYVMGLTLEALAKVRMVQDGVSKNSTRQRSNRSHAGQFIQLSVKSWKTI